MPDYNFNKQIYNMLPFGLNGLILMGYRGSLAHGTHIENHIDDKDVMGIIIPPKEYTYGLKQYEQTERQDGEWDVVFYDFKKFMRLLSGNNPNVMSLLWLKDNGYLYQHKLGLKLIENKDLFVSKLCYKTFGGYAVGQIRKMEKFKFEGYMGEKRKSLVDKFGFDCKNGAHAIRLLKMGIEILTTGDVNVYREDSQLYVSIKKGEWELGKVKEECERLLKLLDEAFIRSKLQDRPDKDKINKLMVEIMEEYYYGRERELRSFEGK